jgi:ubiquinone/menaquinone biosynthesis C-methylase UbiE
MNWGRQGFQPTQEVEMRKRAKGAGALLTFLILGAPRIKLPRRHNIEGIEDPEAAQAYDRLSRMPQFALLRALLVRELWTYQPHGNLADIGCGPGYLLRVLAQAFPSLHLVGIDLSREMIETAAHNFEAAGMGERVEFRVGDSAQLPLEDGSLDFAVSSLSLHHWSDPQRALGEIHRVLKPGGQMLLFDLRRDVRRWFYALFRFVSRFVVPAPLRHLGEPLGSLLSSYTRAEMRQIMATSPFRERRVRGGPVWFYLPDWMAHKNVLQVVRHMRRVQHLAKHELQTTIQKRLPLSAV